MEPRRINKLEDLVRFKDKDVRILCRVDNNYDMAEVSVGELFVMSGNLWDFYPGSHGGWFYDLATRFGDFQNPQDLVARLEEALDAIGAKSIEVNRQEYDFYDDNDPK